MQGIVRPEPGSAEFCRVLVDALTTHPDASRLQMLAALAHLAPACCLELLRAHAVDLQVSHTGEELSGVIVTALSALPKPTPGNRAVLSGLLRELAGVITPDAGAICFAALGAPWLRADRESLDALLGRWPRHPALLRAAITVSQTDHDESALDALLTRLGNADPTPATVSFVYRTRKNVVTARQPNLKIALMSSFTIDHLVPHVDLACRSIGLIPEIYVTPFNSWAREVLDETSGLRQFAPEIAFLSVSIDDLLPELAADPTAEALETGANTAFERVLAVVQGYAQSYGGKTLVVHTFHSAFDTGLGIADARGRSSRNEWIAELNIRLAAALRGVSGTYLLDVAQAVAADGGSLADNPKIRHLAAMRLPPRALSAVANAYVRHIAPLKGLRRKCVVLDLDNTLWGGVVGEDGLSGIRLGHTAPGSEYVEFQHFLRALTKRGILLAINSKNNAVDAIDVLRNHEAMVLQEADFSAIRMNWKPKPQNMIEIAKELNVGLDSLVFVDDNPDEREQMRQMLPDVLTVELPKDPALYRSVLERLPQLQTLSLTAEDRLRVDQYRTAQVRERAKQRACTLDEYLSSLALEVVITRAATPLVPRIAQLFERTNQFNTTTRRYAQSEVEAFTRNADFHLWALSSRDRFGDHGLVAVALVDATTQNWRIDSFLMSCRVIGYGIETTLLAFISAQARDACARELVGEFIETKKNAPAQTLYSRNGFVLSDTRDGTERWRFALANSLPTMPHWISWVAK